MHKIDVDDIIYISHEEFQKILLSRYYWIQLKNCTNPLQTHHLFLLKSDMSLIQVHPASLYLNR